MEKFKVSNIRMETINGRRRKVFDVRKDIGGGWLYMGTYTADPNTPNNKLLDVYYEFLDGEGEQK